MAARLAPVSMTAPASRALATSPSDAVAAGSFGSPRTLEGTDVPMMSAAAAAMTIGGKTLRATRLRSGTFGAAATAEFVVATGPAGGRGTTPRRADDDTAGEGLVLARRERRDAACAASASRSARRDWCPSAARASRRVNGCAEPPSEVAAGSPREAFSRVRSSVVGVVGRFSASFGSVSIGSGRSFVTRGTASVYYELVKANRLYGKRKVREPDS